MFGGLLGGAVRLMMDAQTPKRESLVEKRGLHLQLLGSDPWVLPVRNAINDAVRDGRVAEPSKEFNELCSNVSLRLSLLPRIEKRLNIGWASLREAIKKREQWHEFTRAKQGYGFAYDQGLTFDLVLDIDSFLFEVWSCAELMDTVLKRAYRLTSTPFRKAQEVELTRAVLIQAGRDVRWIDQLAKLRNFFAHQATPYLAVDLSSADSELVILKENVLYLDDDSKFVRMSEFNGIVRGFVESKGSLQEHLIKLFEGCQTAVRPNSKGSRCDSPDATYLITDEYNLKSEE